MNRDYEIFCSGLKRLTNAEALTEISKKIEILAKERRENRRATLMEENLKQLLNKTKNLKQEEMFTMDLKKG